ncbi:hypothetical protein [Streptomyces sp. NPDC000877]|uniref:hypothetical protein n=1 Tax=unclassified Streptomyces TaxID=2593676 RepID=UPI00331A3257
MSTMKIGPHGRHAREKATLIAEETRPVPGDTPERLAEKLIMIDVHGASVREEGDRKARRTLDQAAKAVIAQLDPHVEGMSEDDFVEFIKHVHAAHPEEVEAALAQKIAEEEERERRHKGL